jgi:hypothetical protein
MENIKTILAEREKTHGRFADHAEISQALKAIIYFHSQGKLDDEMKESLEMICHKIARILAGDPKYPDHWFDISGYATRVADSLSLLEPIERGGNSGDSLAVY